MNGLRTSPAAGLLAVVFLWGINFTAMKVALPEIPPAPFTGARFAIGSVLMWLILARREGWRLPPRDCWLPLVVLGIIGNTIYQVCFVNGLAGTTVTNSSLILASMPTVVTVAAGVLGIDKVSVQQRWALAIATMGVVLVVLSRGPNAGHHELRGDLLMLVAVLCWSAYTLGLRSLAGRMSNLALTTWTLITGTVLLFIIGIPGMRSLDWGAVSLRAWLGFGYATVFSLVVAYVLWNRGVRQVGPSRAALFSTLTPLVATSSAMLLLGERPGPLHYLGGAMIIAGVVLSRRPEGSPRVSPVTVPPAVPSPSAGAE